MLSPPNQGSELVDILRHFPLYEWITGPAGQVLGKGPEGVVHRLNPIEIEIEIGVIAGNSSVNPLFSLFLDGPDDGMISVKSTMLPEMRDFIAVPSTHTFIVSNPEAIRQVGHFLKHGKFDHG